VGTAERLSVGAEELGAGAAGAEELGAGAEELDTGAEELDTGAELGARAEESGAGARDCGGVSCEAEGPRSLARSSTSSSLPSSILLQSFSRRIISSRSRSKSPRRRFNEMVFFLKPPVNFVDVHFLD